MVRYTMPNFLELVKIVNSHFEKYKDLDLNEFDIILNNPTKSRTMSFSLEMARIRKDKLWKKEI